MRTVVTLLHGRFPMIRFQRYNRMRQCDFGPLLELRCIRAFFDSSAQPAEPRAFPAPSKDAASRNGAGIPANRRLVSIWFFVHCLEWM